MYTLCYIFILYFNAKNTDNEDNKILLESEAKAQQSNT